MKEYRLFTILDHLVTYRRSTLGELARLCEVSRRTIMRDLAIMTLHQIPVYSKQGRDGGVYLDERYVIDRRLFSQSEWADIQLALSLVASLWGKDSSVSKKVRSVIGSVEPRMEVDLTRWNQTTKERQQVSALNEAIKEKKYVTFDYQKTAGERSVRKVQPIKLVYKNYHWYLQGYCLMRQAVRTFKLSRLFELRVLSQGYRDSHQGIAIDQLEEQNDTELVLRIKLTSKLRLIDAFKDCQFSEDSGVHYLKVWVREDPWLYAHLLSFGDEVEVLRPLKVRAELQQRIEQLFRLYF